MYGKFGQLIDDLLEEKGLTHKELGKMIGRSQQSISKLKKSKRPHYSTIRRLSKALNVDESLFLRAIN